MNCKSSQSVEVTFLQEFVVPVFPPLVISSEFLFPQPMFSFLYLTFERARKWVTLVLAWSESSDSTIPKMLVKRLSILGFDVVSFNTCPQRFSNGFVPISIEFGECE